MKKKKKQCLVELGFCSRLHMCTTFGHNVLTHLIILTYKAASLTQGNKLQWQVQAGLQTNTWVLRLSQCSDIRSAWEDRDAAMEMVAGSSKGITDQMPRVWSKATLFSLASVFHSEVASALPWGPGIYYTSVQRIPQDSTTCSSHPKEMPLFDPLYM